MLWSVRRLAVAANCSVVILADNPARQKDCVMNTDRCERWGDKLDHPHTHSQKYYFYSKESRGVSVRLHSTYFLIWVSKSYYFDLFLKFF